MPRLIDANEILKSEHQHYDYMADEYYVTVRDIENAPTVDPVRHGRWLDVLVVDDDEGETDGVECSECGYTDINVYWAKTYHRFCPNCGAKMRNND